MNLDQFLKVNLIKDSQSFEVSDDLVDPDCGSSVCYAACFLLYCGWTAYLGSLCRCFYRQLGRRYAAIRQFAVAIVVVRQQPSDLAS